MKFTRSAVSANAYVAVWMIGIGMAWWARARLSPPWTDSVFGPGRAEPCAAPGTGPEFEGILVIAVCLARSRARRRAEEAHVDTRQARATTGLSVVPEDHP